METKPDKVDWLFVELYERLREGYLWPAFKERFLWTIWYCIPIILSTKYDGYGQVESASSAFKLWEARRRQKEQKKYNKK